MLQLINQTLEGERLMPKTNDTAMQEVASKYIGVRWNLNQQQFDINKQVKGLRDWKYTSDPLEIPGLIKELVNELTVKVKALPKSGVPKVVLTKKRKPVLINSTGEEIWTIKQAKNYAIKEYLKEGADSSMIGRLKNVCDSLSCLLSGEHTLISELTFAVINVQWEEELIDLGNSKSTINKKKSSIQKMLRNAIEAGHLEHMPVIKRRKCPLPPPRFLKRDEEQGIDEEKEMLSVFKLLGKHEHFEVATVLVDLGCRQSELWLMQEQDVNMSANSIYIRTTKNGNPRTIFMSERVRDFVQKRLTGEMSNRLVFDYDNGWFRNGWDRMRERIPYTKYFRDILDDKGITIKAEHLCEKWCGYQGLEYLGGKSVKTTRMADPGYTGHILRHTCLTRMVGKFYLEEIQEWAGHKSIIVTRRYISVQSKSLKKIAVEQNRVNANLVAIEGGIQRTA